MEQKGVDTVIESSRLEKTFKIKPNHYLELLSPSPNHVPTCHKIQVGPAGEGFPAGFWDPDLWEAVY